MRYGLTQLGLSDELDRLMVIYKSRSERLDNLNTNLNWVMMFNAMIMATCVFMGINYLTVIFLCIQMVILFISVQHFRHLNKMINLQMNVISTLVTQESKKSVQDSFIAFEESISQSFWSIIFRLV